ncbi:ATP11 protein-domain-containing protein [Cyathus striatus]|nr:ATP11 protein-domain-containing protein [Cyathus striatus]
MSWQISKSIPNQLFSWGARHSSIHRLARYYTVNYESKYAEKLKQKAQQEGVSVSELKTKVKREEEERRKKRIEETAVLLSTKAQTSAAKASYSSSVATPPGIKERKDSSPVKPLSTILNLPRLLSSPHTPDQISALWNAYHVSRSGGTGRGYVCATIPIDLYQRMSKVAQRYPAFVVPLSRTKDTSAESQESQDENDTAYEFYYLQWNFHDPPSVPSATEDPFLKPSQHSTSPNPPLSTILLTPLQEFKLRNSFATPYLVFTHYTDLVSTHGVVLLRGEITPSSAASTTNISNYMLGQEDAHRLCLAIQKFYLWNVDDVDGTINDSLESKLLQTFHERPEDFKWEELLRTMGESSIL